MPPQLVSATFTIRNTGDTTANNVRLMVDINRLISSVDVTSTEPYQIIQGSTGENHVIVEIDRMVANANVVVLINADALLSSSEPDQIIMDSPSSMKARIDDSYSIEMADWFGPTNDLTFLATPDEAFLSRLSDDDALLSGFPDFVFGYYAIKSPFPLIYYFPSERPSLEIAITSDEGSVTRVEKFTERE